MSIPVDVCVDWINEKDAVYLCKEDKVIWWASITGREDDKSWQSMTLQQAQRAISFMNFKVSIDDLITAFQEVGGIYEMAVKSHFQTPETIFNLSEHSPMEVTEKYIREMARLISVYNINYMELSDMNFIQRKIEEITNTRITSQERNKYYRKYFGLLNYAFREKDNRVFINGKKRTCIVKASKAIEYEEHERGLLINIATLAVEKAK